MYRVDNTQKQAVRLTPIRADGAPSVVEGALQLAVVSGDGSAELDPSDQLVVWLVSGTATEELDENGVPRPARTIVEVKADAQIGTGEVFISKLLTLEVTAPNAASFSDEAVGGPVPK